MKKEINLTIKKLADMYSDDYEKKVWAYISVKGEHNYRQLLYWRDIDEKMVAEIDMHESHIHKNEEEETIDFVLKIKGEWDAI